VVDNSSNDIVSTFVVDIVVRVTVESSESSVGIGGTDRERGIVKEIPEGDEDGGVDGRDKGIVNSASGLVVGGAVKERGIEEEKSVGVGVAKGGLREIIKTKSDIVEVTDGGFIGGVFGDTGN
jgi:hypothetical protein